MPQSPLSAYLLGLCPALAVSNKVITALGMGLAVTVVLLAAGAAISLLRRLIADRLYPIVSLALIASLVSLLELAMRAYAPALRQGMGVYLELIAVNCLVLGRTEAFARQNPLPRALRDGLGMGAGFTAVLVLIAGFREALGSGTITLFSAGNFDGLIRIPVLVQHPARVLGLAAGALLLLGYLAAVLNRLAWPRRFP
jgi:electron transport complex protein RnfE